MKARQPLYIILMKVGKDIIRNVELTIFFRHERAVVEEVTVITM
jgi:hypothetical protein